MMRCVVSCDDGDGGDDVAADGSARFANSHTILAVALVSAAYEITIDSAS